ncbi:MULTISPECIES: TIM-barrel domain-containing protein [unclassified Microbulbifer]|uniref:TIM-barrel domain-containing protein n=1 Tax=unclassified Microbulbifer TaxID=2619833 RepID=UPI0027E4055D|nr:MULTISPECIES: TIM-barrel domain-containing protein [unclassified Microbulbifer]
MKKKIDLVAAIAAIAVGVASCTTEPPPPASGLDANGHLVSLLQKGDGKFDYRRFPDGVQIRLGDTVKNIIFYGPRTVRVNTNLGENYWQHPSLVVIDQPDPIAFELEDGGTTLKLASEELSIEIDKHSGSLSFSDANGKLYTRESARAPQRIEKVEIADAPSYEVSNTFSLKQDEAIYGFGYIHETEIDRGAQESLLNRRNQELLLVQTNVGSVIPVMMSTENYGVLWDTYSAMKFKDNAEGATLWAESAPGGVDYYFMAGDDMDDVVSAYRDLTGDAPMYPKQAFGLFMSKERYPTQERIVEVARTFREEGFPLDYIVQDWQYWGGGTWGGEWDGNWSGMIWDPERFPEPEAMTSAIHDLNMKLMISIWPSVGNDTPLAAELDSHGLRFEPLHWISKKARIYDAFSEQGREIYFKHVKAGLLDKGVDALWMDGTEVEVGSACWDPGKVAVDIKSLGNNAMGDFSRYLNPYTLMTTMGTYDGQRATSNKRVFTLTRSAWAGAQRTAAASWSGDTHASWDTLRQQISGGASVTITGNPYWTNDIGGFFVPTYPGGEKNPAYRELFTRWFQYGAFNPIMRVHGTDIEREPYIFKELDPAVYDALKQAVELRYRMLPYTYSLSWQVTENDYTLMRALAMDFPKDKGVHNIDDAFMYGPSLLVHPVARPMYHLQDPPAKTIPGAYLRTPDDKPGLAGQYFSGRSFEQPAGKVVDAMLDHTWPGPPLADFPPGLSSLNDFSARWSGSLVAPESGEYEIGLEGDDGFVLYLDGEKVIEDWKGGGRRYHGVKRKLEQGERVQLNIEYYQGEGGRNIRLSWRTPKDIAELERSRPKFDTRVTTYLPAGADWYDYYSGEKIRGGREHTREAPLDIIPLYVRAGSILPTGPLQQYATEKPDAPYDITVYAGADAEFTLYQDDNETYDYERGQYATVALRWDDEKKILNIGERQGSFAGMTEKRELNVRLVSNGRESPPVRKVVYDGSAINVSF